MVSVKGGKQIGPDFVRDLIGTVANEKAQMGVLIILGKPTKGMVDAANHSGSYEWPTNNQTFPRVQIITVDELIDGKRPDLPPHLMPYLQPNQYVAPSKQMTIGATAEQARTDPHKKDDE